MVSEKGASTIKGYMTTREAADRLGLSLRRVQGLCRQGHFPGAVRNGGRWYLPAGAVQKSTGRKGPEHFLPDETKYLTLEELCSHIGISAATGKNWMKLKKLTADGFRGGSPYFSAASAENLLLRLHGETSGALKSRRNKKNIQGTCFYKNYIEGAAQTKAFAKCMKAFHSPPEEKTLRLLLANAALQLFLQVLGERDIDPAPIHRYIKGELRPGPYSPLVADLLGSQPIPEQFPEGLPLCRFRYLPGQDLLGLLYLSLRHAGQKKVTGSYYTPSVLVQRAVGYLPQAPFDSGPFFDPACGTGSFLLGLLQSGVPLGQIYGQDIDPLSIQIARINLALFCLPDSIAPLYQQLTYGDSLTQPPSHPFAAVLGNPPWGYNFPKHQESYLRRNYQTAGGKAMESYELFIEYALRILPEGGRLAFVLPEALFSAASHHAARRLLLEQTRFESVVYLGNAFGGVQCPAMLLCARKSLSPGTAGCRIVTGTRSFVIRENRPLGNGTFSLDITDEEQECIHCMEQTGTSRTLAGNAEFALGIVTGNNKQALAPEPFPGAEPVLRGCALYRYRTDAKQPCYLSFDPERFQQTAPHHMYRAPEKLFYRFICNSLVFSYDNTGMLSLNSCNILIPHIPGTDIKYILAVLNSRAASFYWQKRFRSLKVLRSQLEQIPIPAVGREEQQKITELVERLLDGDGAAHSLYESIDEMIMHAYRLDQEKQKLILDTMRGQPDFL